MPVNNFKFKGRKIQKNLYTYWTTLPPEWITNMNLRKGDEISVEMVEDGSLLIRPLKMVPVAPAKELTGAANLPAVESQHA